MGHSRHASAKTFPHVSLFMKGDDSAKTVPAPFTFQRTSFWLFRSIAAEFDRVSPGSKHFIGRGCWPKFVSQCCVRRVSLTVPKPLDSCSTIHNAVVTSRAFPSLCFLVVSAGSSPGPYTQCGIRVPSERLMLDGGVFLYALLYCQ